MKIRNFILALTALCSLTASALTREDLIRGVAELNANVPISMGMMGNITSATVDSDTIVYNISLDGLGDMTLNQTTTEDIQKKLLLDNIAIVSKFSPELSQSFKILAESNFYLKYLYTNPQSETTVVVTISPKDFVDAQSIEPDYKSLAEYNITTTRNAYPIEMSGMKLIDIQRKGNDVISTAIVDEDVISIETMIENADFMKQYFLRTLQSGAELSTLTQSYIFAKAGYNQVYLYKGSSSGKSVSYSVVPEDIFSITGNIK